MSGLSPVFRFFLAVLVACVCFFLLSTQANAQSLGRDEKAWLSALAPFVAHAKQQGIDVSVSVDSNPRAGDSPAAVDVGDGKCHFIIAVYNNPVSQAVQRLASGEDGKELARTLVMAHEYGHCLHHVALTKGAQLPPVASAQGEAMADVFAVAWIAQTRPEDYMRAVDFFKALRTNAGADASYALSLKALDRCATWQFDKQYSPVQHAYAVVKGYSLN